MKNVKKCYDEQADDYDERYTGRRGRYFQSLEDEYILYLIGEPNSVLDIGTGTGRIVRLVDNHCDLDRNVGIDISKEMLQKAALESQRPFLNADATRLPFHAGTFDLVTAIGIFEYVEDLRPFLREIKYVLNQTGKLVFTAHNSDPLFPTRGPGSNEWYDLAQHSVDGIRTQLSDVGFSINKIYTTFYFNEYVWRGTRVLSQLSGRVADRFLSTAASAQKLLSQFGPTSGGGRELIISATVR
jgi:ubiquinone/menaquinone biosynthesis C-methylase UbiE